MTVIVGYIHKGTVWMGGDAAIHSGDDKVVYANTDPKVFIKGPYIIGYSGDLRIGQILHYVWKEPTLKKYAKTLPHMCSDFAASLKKAFDSSTDPDLDILVGFRGRLFMVDNDFSVVEQPGDFAAVGCGSDFAVGSLLTQDSKVHPEKKVKKALEVSAIGTPFVLPPWKNLSKRLLR